MNTTNSIFAFLALTALAAGCAPEGKSNVNSKKLEVAAEQMAKVKGEAKEAVQAIQDYAFTQKADFVTRMKAELDGFQKELDELAIKANDKVRMDAAKEKWAQAKLKLEQAEAATEENWNEVKEGFKSSYVDLKDTVGQTRKWLSEKIAP